MKIAAIIAECNPFHKGHEYLIRTVREKTGADRVFFLMSGDYVQRGVPACTERRVRTEMALRCGADAVFSYPLRYCTSSGEAFARHAVEILNGFGCVDILAFGSECGDLAPLLAAADCLLEESETFRESLKENLREGISFPKARALAAGEYGSLLSSPNNILAVEYLKALRLTGSKMEPFTVKRETGGSGSEIREMLVQTADSKVDGEANEPNGIVKEINGEVKELNRKLKEPDGMGNTAKSVIEGLPHLKGMEKEIPAEALKLFEKEIEERGTVSAEDFSLLLQNTVLYAASAEELCAFEGMTRDLAGAIMRERAGCFSFEAFSERLHTKNRVHAAVNRALLHLVIGIRRTEEKPYFTQLLGFRREAADLLHEIGQNTQVPVISKAADAGKVLDGAAFSDFQTEQNACDLYEGIRSRKSGCIFRPEITKNVVIV